MASLDGGNNWQHKNLGISISLLGGDYAANDHVYLVGHGGLIIDFDVNNINKINIRKHPSGAAFSAVAANDDKLLLAGQFGITSWSTK
ncbi:MAG: hypothetical protein DRQ47_11150 [Gammaproteobacteria bacterium]|nr:MAG: hypothetical protein DRQ47_11150 [Gammaproteobacteria bacterium]